MPPQDNSPPKLTAPQKSVKFLAADRANSFQFFKRSSTALTKEIPVESKTKTVSTYALFRFATMTDFVLLCVGFVCACGNGASMSAFAILMGGAFNQLNSVTGITSATVLNFVYVGIGTWVAGAIQQALFTITAERMTIRMRERYLSSVLSQEVGYFDVCKPGELATAVAENAVLFRDALGDKLGQLVQFMCMFLAGVITGFSYSWKLTLIILCVTPLIAISGAYTAKHMRARVTSQLAAFARAGAIAEETFQLIRTVTGLGLQPNRVAAFDVEVKVAADQAAQQGWSIGVGSGAVFGLFLLAYALAFYCGSIFVTQDKTSAALAHPPQFAPNGNAPSWCFVGSNNTIPAYCSTMPFGNVTFGSLADVCSCWKCDCGCYVAGVSCFSAGQVMTTFFAVLLGAFGLGQSGPSWNALASARVAAFRIFEIIDRVPLIADEDEKGLILPKVEGEIRFDNVGFYYPTRGPEAPVFKDFSLHIKAGSRVALVGQSGSGKSSVVGLLQRFYDPVSGSIQLDGVDIRKLNLRWLRQQTGLVSQEPTLFSTSIMENVRFGKPDASDEDVIEACRMANAQNFIEGFPEQYKTFVGIGGSQLSGGQKQRIAIARALLRNPKVLLLDEATAALDNESERLVNEAIEKLLTGAHKRTTLVIAHRLSSIKSCDEIVVMQQGAIVERGTHKELAAKPAGAYAALLHLADSAAHEGPHHAAAEFKVAARAPMIGQSSFMETSLAPPKGEPLKEIQNKPPKKRKSKSVSFRRVFAFTKPDQWWLVPALYGSAGVGVTFPLLAFFLSHLVSVLYLPTNALILYNTGLWALAFLALGINHFFCSLIQNTSFGILNGRMTSRVRRETFRALLRNEIGFFDDKDNSVGQLTSKLTSDAALVKATISDRLGLLIQNVSTLGVGLGLAFAGSWQIALVVLATFPLIVFTGFAQQRAQGGVAEANQKELNDAAATISEAVSAIRTVKALNLKQSICSVYNEQLERSLTRVGKAASLAGLGFGFGQSSRFFINALVYWYGNQLLQSNTITFQQLIQAMMGVLMSAIALGQAMAVAGADLAKGRQAVISIIETLDRVSKIDSSSAAGDKPTVALGDLQFNNVTFAYPSRPEAVVTKDLSLNVPRGSTVAFVGQSGSGKSSLVNLLERFYDPLEGQVLFDGRDVKELNVQWLRQQMAMVSQEPALFDTTIMDNIRFGRLDATDEECIQAAKDSNADGFICALPEGYNTRVGAKGTQLSGGQKQRVAIARALIRKPAVLLLDEATSALDEESQRIVQEALDRLLQQSTRTTIVVAHRLSTIRNADMIVVLEQGKVVEMGTFDELIEAKGAFAALASSQEGV